LISPVLSPADYIVVALYLIAVLAAGFWFARANRGGKDFFIGGNRIPWWAAGISLYMTTFSAWMFTGAASFVYNTGWFGFLYFTVKPIGFVIGFLLAAVRWRRARITSPVEYVEERYNHTTRLALSIVLVVSMMYWPAHHLASVAKISAPALFPNMPFAVDALILFFGAFVLVYSVAGGIWAVSMTDVLQFIVLLSVCIVLIVAIFVSGDVGSPGTVLAAVPAIEFSHSFRPGTTYTHWYIIGFLVSGIFGNVVGDKAQRFFMVRDERAARKTGWLAFVLFLTAPLLFGIPPLVGKVLWPEVSQLAALVGDSKPDESIFIAVVMRFLPAGVVGLFIAAMVAASMSALDSVWNTVSAIVSVDLYKGHLRPDANDRELLVVGRVTVVVLAVAAVTMALFIVHSSLGIFTISNMVLGLVGIPVTVPLFLGIVTRVPSPWSAIPSILAGIVMAIVTRFALDWTLGPQYLAVIATCFAVQMSSGWLGALYVRSRPASFASATSIGLLLLVATGLPSVPTMDPGVYNRALGADGSGVLWLLLAIAGIVAVVAFFIPLFARDFQDAPERVQRFFDRLDRPIDVASELLEHDDVGHPNRLIAWCAMGLGIVPLLLLAVYGTTNWLVYVSLSAILLGLGAAFYYIGDAQPTSASRPG
jgi:Na+/proline symporter